MLSRSTDILQRSKTKNSSLVHKAFVLLRGRHIGLLLGIALLMFNQEELPAQVISNNGAAISITNGAAVVTGNVDNNSSGTIANDGTLSAATIDNNAAIQGNGTYNLTGNWTNDGTFTSGTSTVAFIGTSAQQINGTVSTTFHNLTLNNTAGLTNTFTVTTVNNNLTLTDGIFTLTSGLTMGNGATIIRGDGNLSAVPTFGTTVNMQYTNTGAINPGVEMPLSATVLNNLTINNSAPVTLLSSLQVNGNLTLTAGELAANTSSITMAGGDWTNNGGTFTPGSGTVNFTNTTAAQAINGTAASQTFNNITAAKTAQVLSVGGSTATLTLNGGITLTSGTFSAGTAATINIAGDWTNNGGTFTPGSGTVNFNSTSAAQQINGTAASQTFNNVTVTKTAQTLSAGGSTTALTVNDLVETSGNFTAPATLDINGNATLTAGTFTAGTTITLAGNWTNNGGTFTAGSGTVTLNGTGQIIGGSAFTTFNNLTIDAATTGSASFNANGTVTLNANLSMTTPNILTLGSSATITGTGDVAGRTERTSFTIGNTYNFGNAFTSITFTSASTLPTSVIVNTTVGTAPTAGAIQRSYDITKTGGTSEQITLRLHYLDGELNGNTETSLTQWNNSGGGGAYVEIGRTTTNQTDNWVEKTQISSFVQTWTLDQFAVSTFTSVASGNWNTPATWGLTGTPTEGINYPGAEDSVVVRGNFTVTLSANHSASGVRVQDNFALELNPSTLEVGTYTLTIGNGGLTINGTGTTISTVNVGGGVLTIGGNLTMDNNVNATLNLAAGANSTLNITGSITKGANSTFTAGSSSTVNYNGTAAQTLLATNIIYANVSVNNAAGVTLGAAITATNLTGNLRVQSGTLNNGGFAISGDAGKTFEVASGATFVLTGTSAFPTTIQVSLNGASIVRYSGTTQTIAQQVYGDLEDNITTTGTVSTSLTVAGTYTKSGAGTTTLSGTSGDNLAVNKFVQSTGTFNDNGRTITVAGTGAGVWNRTGGTFTTSGTTLFTGSSPEIGASNFSTLEINVGSTATAGGILTATNFTLTSGTFDPGTFVHNMSGSLTVGSGTTLLVRQTTFAGTYGSGTPSMSAGSTVEYAQTGSTIANFTYSNLRISGTVTGSSTAAIGGLFTLPSVSNTFNNPGGTLTFNDGASIVNSGTLNFSSLTIANSATVTSSSSFGINGTLTVGTGSNFAPTGTTTLNSATIVNSGTLTFQTLSLNGTVTANTSYKVNSSFTGSGALDANSGTVTLGGGCVVDATNISFQNLSVIGAVTANVSYTVKGSLSIGISGVLNPTAGTVTMNGGSISNSGTLSFQNLTTSGTVTMNTSFTVKGTFSNGGTINQTSGIVTMGSSTTINNTGALTFKNLTIGGTTGGGSFGVDGTLTLNGNLAMGANTLSMGSSAATAGSADVTGKVSRSSFSLGTPYDFGNTYTTVTFSSGTVPTSVEFDISTGSAPAAKTDAVNRYYAITATGGSYISTLRLHYLTGELNGNTATALDLWQKPGASYDDSGRTAYNTTEKWVEKENIATLTSEWTLADKLALGFTAAVTGNWNDPTTWGLTGSPVEGVNYPGPVDNVFIGGAFAVTLTANHSAATVTVESETDGTALLELQNYNLTIGSGGLTITGGNSDSRIARVTVGGGTLAVTGSVTLDAASAVRSQLDISSGASQLHIGGAFTKSSAGTFTPGLSSTVNFNGTSSQTLNLTDFSYANVILNNTSTAGITSNAAITSSNVTGNLRVLSGTFDNGGFAIDGDPLKTIEVANSATLVLGGTSAFPTGFGTITLGSASTVRYGGTTQTIAQQPYGNLTDSISTTGTVNDALTITGTFRKAGAGTTTLSGTAGENLTASKFYQSTGTFNDNGRTITISGTGADTWTKTGGTFTTSGTANFTGASPQIGASNFNTLQISVSAAAEATGSITASNVALSTGTFNPGSYLHTISGNFTLANGTRLLVAQTTFGGNYSATPTSIAAGSTIEYTAAGSTVANMTYSNLTVSGTVTSSSTATIGGIFNVSGAFDNPGGTLTFNNGASIQNSGTLNFSSITIANSAAVSSSASFGINGTLTVGTGATSSFIGTTTLNSATLSNSGTLSFTNLALSGTITANTNYSINGTLSGSGTLNATSGTVTLNTGAALTAANVSFQNLTVSGAITANASYNVKGTLTVGASGNLNAASGTVTVSGGTIDNSGTLSFNNLTTSGTVTMNTSFTVKGAFSNSGTINQSTGALSTSSGASIGSTGTLTLNDLTIGGSTTGNNSFTVNGTVTLNADLAMSSTNVLTLGSGAAISGTGDITGRTERTSFGTGTPYSFGNAFTTIEFASATTFPTSIVVNVTTGSAPAEKTDAILRSYDITKTGGTGETVTLRLRYKESELNGNDELSLTEWNKSGSNYVEVGQTTRNQTDNWVEYTGITAYSNTWTLANFVPLGFNAAVSGNWNDPATWGLTGTPTEGVNYPGPNDIANISLNGNITVTLTQDQSAQKLNMAASAGFGANTRTLAVGSYTLDVGSGGISLTGTAIFANRTVVITVAGGTLNVESSISMDATAANLAVIDLTGGTGSTINIGGNISRSAAAAGSIIFNSTGIINFNGTAGGQTFDVRSSAFGNVYLNNTDPSGVDLIGDITTANVLGDLRVQTGLFNTGGYAVAGNSGKTLELASNTTLVLPGTVTFPSGFTSSISSTSTINYSGGAQDVADLSYGNLILSGSGSKNITTAISAVNSFTYSSSGTTSLSSTSGQNLAAKTVTITAGTFNDNGRTINVSGTNGQVWTKSGGTFTTSGTVNITGAGAEIGASNFATLNINPGIGETATALGSLTPTNFTLTTGTFNPGTYTHTIASTFTLSNGTTLLVQTPTFAGNYVGTPTPQNGSTVEYANSGASVSNAFTYRNLEVSGTVNGSANATVNEAFTITGTFTPSSGTITMNDNSSIVNSGVATFRDLTIAAGATVTTSSSFGQSGALTVGAGGTFAPQGTVTMSGGSIVNGGSLSFNNLTITSSVTTSSSFTVNNTLSIQGSGELDASAGTVTMTNGSAISNSGTLSFFSLQIAGTVTANTSFNINGTLTVDALGSLNPSSGTVTMLGGASIVNSGGTLSFNNLTVSGAITANTDFTVKSALNVGASGNLTTASGTVTVNAGGSLSNSGTLSLSGLTIAGVSVTGNNSFAVTGTLTLSGNLSLSSNILDLGTSATIAGTGEVTGNVRRAGTFSTGTAYTFGNLYSTVTFASGTLPTSITFNISTGSAPAEKTDAIQRYYDVSTAGGGAYSATVRLRFQNGELNGNDAASLSLWRKVGVGAYADLGKTGSDLVDNWVEKSGITSLAGSWTMANQLPAGFNAMATGFWNLGATWGNNGNDVEGSGYPGPADIANISGNYTVTLQGNQSALRVNVNGHSADGQSVVDVGTYTLNVGTSGLRITGGSTDARIAKVMVAGGTINVTGDVILTTASAARAVLDLGATATSTLSVGGAMTKSSTGTFTAGTSSTVNFNGTSTGQTMNVASFDFANATFNNTSGSGVTLNGNITTTNVTGNVSVQSGYLSNGGYAVAGNAGKTFEVANGATFYLTGTSSFPTGFGTVTLGAGSTVNYSGGTQSIANQTYGNLTLAGSVGKTISTPLSAAGTFTYSSSGSTSLSASDDLTCAKFLQTAGTFSDNGRTITVTGAGAATWSKSGGTFTATGTVNFTGTAPQIGASNFGTLQVSVGSGNTATATGALTPANLVLTSGTFDPGSILHTITTNFTLASGTTLKVNTATYAGNYSIDPTSVSSGAIVEYTSSSATVANTFTYSDLKISGTVTGSSSPSVNGAFTVTGTFNNPGGTVTLNNGASVVSSGTLNFSNVTIAASGTVTSSANFGVNGTITVGTSAVFAPSGTVTMNNGSAITNSGSLTFGSLTIAGTVSTSSSFSINSALIVNSGGDLSPSGGSITFGGTSSITNSSGVLTFSGLIIGGTVTTASSFSIGGALSVSSGSLSAAAGTITMNNGASIANSAALSFYNLAIGTSSTVTTSSNFTVANGLSVLSGAVFNPNGASTITMSSGSSISNAGTLAFNNITVSGGTVTGSSNFSVNGTLTLSGTLAMGSNILTMGSSSGTAGSGDVTGNVRRTSFSVGTPYSFGNSYTEVTINSATVVPSSITVNIALGSPPAEKTDAVNRKYTVTETGGSGYLATMRLHYLDAELNGNTAGILTLWKDISGTYQNQGRTGTVDVTNKWVEKNVISTLSGAWTLSNQPTTGFTAAVSGNWNVGATWGNAGDDVEGSGYPGPSDDATVTGNFTVTVATASQSVRSLDVTGSSAADGTSAISIGANSLTIGNGGLVITGGSTAARIASVTVGGGTLTVQGDLTFATADAVRAVLDLSAGANSTLNVGGNMVKSSAGTFTPGTSSTVNFNGASTAQTVDVTNFTYANLKLSNTSLSGATLGAAITAVNVTGNVTVAAGIFSNGGFAIAGNGGATFQVDASTKFNITGTSTFPTGFGTYALTAGSEVEYSGGAQTVDAAVTYADLHLSGTGSKTIPSALTVNGTFEYSSSASSTLPAANPSLTTNKFILSSGTLVDNGGTIVVIGTGSGVWTKSGGVFTSTGTTRFTGAAPQIGASNFGTLEIAAGSGNTAAAAGILTSTNFTLTSGTFDPGAYSHTISGSFTLASGTTLLVRGAQFVTNYGGLPTSVAADATIEYTSSAVQTISQSISYGTLKLTGGGSNEKSAGGAMTIGHLIINSGATFNAVSYSHAVTGDWTNNGGFTPSTSTITFNGTTAQIIGGTSSTSYNNLAISNTSAEVAGNASISVGGTMTVNAGAVFTPAAASVISGSGTLTGGGSIKVTRTSATADFLNQYTISNKTLTSLTVMYEAAAAQTVNALNYYSLTIAGARGNNNVTLASGTIGVSNTFTLSASFNPTFGYVTTGSTVNFNGNGAQTIPAFNYNNLTSSSTGARTLASGGTIGVAGTFTAGTNSYTVTGSTVSYNASGAQTVTAFAYNNLEINGTGVKTLGAGVNSIAGDLAVSNGTFNLATLTANRTSSGGTLTIGAAGTMLVAGSSGGVTGSNFPGNFTTFAISGTVEYNGTGVQTIAPATYHHLLFSGGGAKTIDADQQANGNVTQQAGTSVLVTSAVTNWQINGDLNTQPGFENNGVINIGN